MEEETILGLAEQAGENTLIEIEHEAPVAGDIHRPTTSAASIHMSVTALVTNLSTASLLPAVAILL